jgi:hypothetical protein
MIGRLRRGSGCHRTPDRRVPDIGLRSATLRRVGGWSATMERCGTGTTGGSWRTYWAFPGTRPRDRRACRSRRPPDESSVEAAVCLGRFSSARAAQADRNTGGGVDTACRSAGSSRTDRRRSTCTRSPASPRCGVPSNASGGITSRHWLRREPPKEETLIVSQTPDVDLVNDPASLSCCIRVDFVASPLRRSKVNVRFPCEKELEVPA